MTERDDEAKSTTPEGRADVGPAMAQAFLGLFDGHFPGHTLQRLRTPDGRYRYTYVSPGVKETFGLDPEALKSADGVAHEWVHGDDRDRFLAALETSARTLEPLDEEVQVRLPDGRFKWVRSIGHPRRLADDSVLWDGVALDVTDRHEALEVLQQSLSAARRDETSLARLAGIAAQDISVPFGRLRRSVAALGADGDKHGSPEVDAVADALDELEHSLGAALGLLGVSWPDREGLPGPARRQPSQVPATTLTRRQHDVLSLVQEGLSNREIAESLGITEGTAKLHVSGLLKRLGVRNRTEAARRFAGNVGLHGAADAG